MFKVGQQISVYKVNEILSETESQFCCLTEDPFFHSTILLIVHPLSFVENKQQRKELLTQLETLVTQLESPSIAPVFDSDCEGDYFYYTTNYNYQDSLSKRIAAGLSSEDILKIIHDLGCALSYAVTRGIVHGKLDVDDIYFGDDGQAVIAGFGIRYCLKCFTESQDLKWSENQALQDLGQLLLLLLRPSEQDNSGRELELLSGIENEQLRKVTERFFSEKPDRYQSFSELIDALDALLEKPPIEKRPIVQHKSLQAGDDIELTGQQREKVLAHVRKLISEKKYYKDLLDEALVKQHELSEQLKQSLLDVEKSAQLQLMAPDMPVAYNRKKIIAWVFAGIAVGLAFYGGYRYSMGQNGHALQAQSKIVEAGIVEVPSNTRIMADVQPVLKKRVVVVDEPKSVNIAPDSNIETPPDPLMKSVKKTPVIAARSQQWWPEGHEFETAVIPPKTLSNDKSGSCRISPDEHKEILHTLTAWADAWTDQNQKAYLSHYSGQYRPELGGSRKSWLETRKIRLLRPDWIKVDIQDVSMRRVAADQVQIKFRQKYESNIYRDEIWKSINMVNENGKWLILMERSLGKVD